MELEFHEAADIFPLMGAKAFETFKADVAAQGLKHSIVLHEGKILDGRTRYRACKETGTPIKTIKWDGKGSVVGYLISVHERRDLTTSQKAMVAAHPRVFKHFHKKAAKQKEEGQKKGGGDRKSAEAKIASLSNEREAILPLTNEATTMAGAAMGVSRASVIRGRMVQKSGSEKMKAAVVENRVSVNAAGIVAHSRSHCQQNKLLDKGQSAVSKLAAKLNAGKPRKARTTPQLIKEIVDRLETLRKRIVESNKGVSLQRETHSNKMLTCIRRVKDVAVYLEPLCNE